MSARHEDLLGLARLLGIAPRHTDALGQTHEVSDEVRAALIAGFGLPSHDPAAARRQIEEETPAACFGLSPVQILTAKEASRGLALSLPAGDRRLGWICRFEGGGEISGRLLPGESLLRLPPGLPLGYHRLAIEAGADSAEMTLAVAPEQCHLPPPLGKGGRAWGVTCQLYGLQSARNWGIGDFGDLARLVEAAGARGASALGINPLHALFAAEPRHASPYSPSSRVFLDYLYIDVAAVPGFAEDKRVQALASGTAANAALSAVRASELVDYAAVAALKLPLLEALFRSFCERELDREGAKGQLGGCFREFQRNGGRALRDFALFEALHEHFLRSTGNFAWRDWPAAMHDPHSPAVADFAEQARERVEFFEFLQWQADCQLAAAAAAGQAAGLDVGLYRDLAVGADRNGAEAWADPSLLASGASIGAPPDALNRKGQNWGLAPINPLTLKRRGYAPFIAMLRANMRHCGVLRIDHVMSLMRLYWVPRGMPATNGAYVEYPFEDLLRLLALESVRHKCAVIGEDLGTVPDGFRERMQDANVLSYRVLVFERSPDGGFMPPRAYPPLAAAATATHDIATLKGFWLGRDLEWRRRLGLYPDEAAAEAEAEQRRRDRPLLLDALAAEGLIARERFGDFLSAAGEPSYSSELRDAILAYLARSRSRLLLIELEDLLEESEQPNLPGTSDQHPNWRRRASRPLEAMLADPDIERAMRLVKRERAAVHPEH